MKTAHPMFLKWLLMNIVFVCLFILLAVTGFANGVQGAPAIAMALIIGIGAGISAYAGKLYWQADVWLASGRATSARDDIIHSGEHVFYAVAILQLIGLVGAIMGYRQETHSASLPDAAQAIHALTLGLGNGLTATLFGVLASVLVWVQHHVLVHKLTHPNQ